MEISDIEGFKNSLKRLSSVFDRGGIPFQGEEEALIDTLTDGNSGEADFYRELVRIINMKLLLRKSFEYDDLII